MEFTDIQLTLTVVVLTAAALVVLFDYRRKQRQHQQPQRIKNRPSARAERSILPFEPAPLDYLPARKLAAQRPLEPLVATMTVAKRPTVQPAARETVTVQMAGPADGMSADQSSASLPAFTIDAALWERLVASMPKHDLLTAGGESDRQLERAKPAPAIDVAPGALDANYQVLESESQSTWPTGMIQQPVLQQLLADGEPFSGLVVSIGVNDSDSSMWHSQGLMHSVGNYLIGLLHEQDFSCRTDYDEFILVCPGEHGAQSQRRLNHVSERLWDYQLRGIGASSILFSWGGVQVKDQPLSEAVASAVDRMRQTKRAGSPSGLARLHQTAV
jgi:hypothetical protein